MRQGASMRATAMRTADLLSRLNLDVVRATSVAEGYAKREAVMPRPLRQWPDIDVDMLMPGGVSEDRYINVDDGASPAVWPVDYAMAFPVPDSTNVRLTMVRTLDLRAVRGRVRRMGRFNVETADFDIDTSAALTDWGAGYYTRFNRTWVNMLTGGNYVSGTDGPQSNGNVPLIIGAALNVRYEWSAVFAFPNGMRLRFGTTAAGALSLFRDRDKPFEGRRLALLHWVRQHWRRAATATDLVAVRKHLRGVTKINWRGMDVSIVPSEYELEQIA